MTERLLIASIRMLKGILAYWMMSSAGFLDVIRGDLSCGNCGARGADCSDVFSAERVGEVVSPHGWVIALMLLVVTGRPIKSTGCPFNLIDLFAATIN